MLNLVSRGADRLFDAHAFGRLVPDAPEVDHVAAGAEFRRGLDDGRCVTRPVQPVRECRAGNAGAADCHPHNAILPPPRPRAVRDNTLSAFRNDR